MPYILKNDRGNLDYLVNELLNFNGSDLFRGRFNYFVHKLVKEYIKRFGENYNAYKEIIGELEASKLEVVRRLVSEYENQKIKENGDVE